MVRKSDRNKAKSTSAPDKTPVAAEKATPRKSNRYSRRRKKSSSASESEEVHVEKEVVKEAQPAPSEKKTEEDTGKRRHTRSHPRSSNSEAGLKLPNAESEWKEDADFWGSNEETNKTDAAVTETKEDEEGGIWKVQNSNGSRGEIQKLKICRQRPPDATDSSSPSPSKDSSPWRKRSHSRRGEDESLDSTSSAHLDSEVTSSTAPEGSEQMDADSSGIQTSEVEEGGKTEVSDSTHEVERDEANFEASATSNPSNEEISESCEAKVSSPSAGEKETPDSSTRKSDDEDEKSELEAQQVLDEREEAEPEKESEPVVNKSSGDSEQQDPQLHKKGKRTFVDSSNNEKEVEVIKEAPKEKLRKVEERKSEEREEEKSKVVIDQKVKSSEEKSQEDNQEPELAESEKSEVSEVEKEEAIEKEESKNQDVESPKEETVNDETEHLEGSKPKTLEEGNAAPEREEGEISPVQKCKNIILINKPAEVVKPTVFIRRTDGADDPGAVSRKRRISANKKKPEMMPLEAAGPLISSQSLKLIVPDAKPITEEELDLQEENEKKKEPPEDVLEMGELESIEDAEEKEEGEVDKTPVPPKRLKPITIERKVTIEKREEPPRPQTKKTYITFESPKEPKKEVKEEKPKLTIVRTEDRIKGPPVRKISVVPDTVKKVRSPSPTSKKATEVLFITNLVRPFTVPQLRELLARTGQIAQNGFYIDKIKSKCYVKYTDVEMAIETRHALHGVRWPVNNPKTLRVEFASSEDMSAVQKLAENESLTRTDPSEPGWLNEQSALKPVRRVTAGVREWDVGKINLMEADAAEKENKMKEEWPKPKEKEVVLKKRTTSPDTKDHPARKIKKKDTDTSALILNTLFRKTKATPCIFWLPLTPAQVAAKADLKKQQRAAEQERRLADPKKSEHIRRDRERDRDRDRERRKK